MYSIEIKTTFEFHLINFELVKYKLNLDTRNILL